MMVIRVFKVTVLAVSVLFSGCSLQPTEQRVVLDIEQDPETVLSFKGEAYGISAADSDKLQAIAEEMAESFYWHSLPQPDMLQALGNQKLPWTPRKRKSTQPSPSYETRNSQELKDLIDKMYAGFNAYRLAYREAHPESDRPISCSSDSKLCAQYVEDGLRKNIRELRNVYIRQILEDQLEPLGHIDLTSNNPEDQVVSTDKPFVLIMGEYKVSSLSETSADRLFRGRTFMEDMSRYPCLFLVEMNEDDNDKEPQKLNAGNTAYCGIKLYSGVSNIAIYLNRKFSSHPAESH